MLFNLSEQNSIANHFVSELRDVTVQNDRLRFRKNVERLGQVMAYEISKKFAYKRRAVLTPLGTSNISLMQDSPVLITVMRAGLPFFQGFLDFFDRCDCGFIGAYRKEDGEDDVVGAEVAEQVEHRPEPGRKRARCCCGEPCRGERKDGPQQSSPSDVSGPT